MGSILGLSGHPCMLFFVGFFFVCFLLFFFSKNSKFRPATGI